MNQCQTSPLQVGPVLWLYNVLLANWVAVIPICDAGECGYHVAPLLDVLAVARARSQVLLVAEFRPQIRQAVASGSGTQLPVPTTALATELSDMLGLPLGIGSSGQTPQPPFQAPFSAAIPALLRHCKRCSPSSLSSYDHHSFS